ncbi:MAG: tyrosine-type recombinase/integrase [Tamlana sp.]
MNKFPTIVLKPKFHRNSNQILIQFEYNETLIKQVRTIPNATWSQSLKSWFIKNNPSNLKLIFSTFKNYAHVNSKPLFEKPEKKPKVFPIKKERQLSLENKNLLNNFYKYLRGKRYSDNTVKTYSFFIADFMEFNNHRNLATLNNKDVELFIEKVFIDRKYAISTQRQFISAVKLFIAFYPESEIRDLELKRPKKSKILPNILSQEDIINLLRFTKNLKHRAILALLYSAGLRISEVINLRIEHILINRRQLIIKNAKGRKDRYVTLAESFLPLLFNYLNTYTPKVYFVEGKHGEPYSSSSIRKFLSKSCKAAGIKTHVTPHTLRHSYATHLLENGVSIRHIQELLGHSKTETTMIYTHVTRKDLVNIKSPLDHAISLLKETQNEEQKFLLSLKN